MMEADQVFWLTIRRAILMCDKDIPPAFRPAALMVAAAVEARYKAEPAADATKHRGAVIGA